MQTWRYWSGANLYITMGGARDPRIPYPAKIYFKNEEEFLTTTCDSTFLIKYKYVL